MALKLFGKGGDDTIDQISEDIIDFAADEIGEEIVPAVRDSGRHGGRVGGLFNNIMSLKTLLVTMVLVGTGAAWLYYKTTTDAARDTTYIEKSSQLLMLSQRVAKDAREAVQGQEISFKTLKESRDTFDRILGALQNGDASTGLAASPETIRPVLNDLVNQWTERKNGVRNQVNQILTQEKTLFALRDHVLAINQLAPLLLSIADETVEVGSRAGMKQNDLYLASRQGMLSQRIAKDVNLFAQGGNEAAVAAAQFGKDAKLFKDTDSRLRKVAPAAVKSKLNEANEVFSEMNTHVEGILSNAAELFVSQRASKLVVDKSDVLLEKVRALVDSYAGLGEERAGSQIILYALAIVLLVCIVAIGWRFVQDEKDRAELSAEQSRTTQDAILKLLDEMGNLADGDLTVEPEVTEQITGAIADSINFAVKEMRNLVMRIKTAAQQVALASESSRQTATELTEAALRQAAQITETSDRMNVMARSMEDMSQSAEKSAEVAQGSVQTAKRGAEAVQDTITGMDQMREQIQETAKRIKRLGESSQQIGEIVELINDISEQTNILSLNAAIQAAMAGEAGRGFAVVADEVQRLAERSGEATKQIADLVKTIQADTNEAVASMEEATNGVVATTRLADAAGQALGEIESVSEQLSDLIVGIARDALEQSESAGVVSENMAKIQETTNLTSSGTRQTAEAIGKLSDLARELQESVAGFRLPA
ncbi:MAG: methyl-accepting chemotaxis protein [Gammaproteobacteria bacterium]|nr:methyl-accepting chemotaxis protein [Gammaproteobacteria bacterium]